ncbi:hypothetical protein JTB14_028189 [Gonioctena quinquepunctata]|nr:hypothetical protein JTB14_028189 [Gonioctena quinquepunctata]
MKRYSTCEWKLLIHEQRGFFPPESLEIAYDFDIIDTENIHVEPPYVSALTDEDSGDGVDDRDPNHISGRQHRAQAELKLAKIEELGHLMKFMKIAKKMIISKKHLENGRKR